MTLIVGIVGGDHAPPATRCATPDIALVEYGVLTADDKGVGTTLNHDSVVDGRAILADIVKVAMVVFCFTRHSVMRCGEPTQVLLFSVELSSHDGVSLKMYCGEGDRSRRVVVVV